MEDSDTIIDYVTKIHDLVDQLASLRQEIDSRTLISTMLNNIAPSYAIFEIVLSLFNTARGDHAENDNVASFNYVVG